MILAEILKMPAKFDCLKHPVILQLESLKFTPFHVISLCLFALAVIHTLAASWLHEKARKIEARHKKGPNRPLYLHVVFFLSEIEVIFAIWAIPLFIFIIIFYGLEIGLEYINTRDYTEALFVVVILAMASTRPIVKIAERAIKWIAKGLGGSLPAWWFSLLAFGPLLG